MELRQYIKYHTPLSTQFEITACLNYMKCHNIFIGPDVEKALLDNTLPELHDILQSCMESYKTEYQIRQKPKPFITRSKDIHKQDTSRGDGLSNDDRKRLIMFSMRNNSRGKYPSDLGYDYGLSDW